MRVAAAIAALAAFGALLSAVQPRADEVQPARPAKAQPLGFAPLDYFDKKCARCHGPSGAFYGDHFAKDLTPEELARVVKEMTEGPGKAPLEGRKLDALVSFHRALISGKPYIVWVDKTDKGLIGEVTAGSALRADTPHGQFPAKVTGVEWVLEQPGLDPNQVKLTAEIGKRKTTLELSESPFSHFKQK